MEKYFEVCKKYFTFHPKNSYVKDILHFGGLQDDTY